MKYITKLLTLIGLIASCGCASLAQSERLEVNVFVLEHCSKPNSEILDSYSIGHAKDSKHAEILAVKFIEAEIENGSHFLKYKNIIDNRFNKGQFLAVCDTEDNLIIVDWGQY